MTSETKPERGSMKLEKRARKIELGQRSEVEPQASQPAALVMAVYRCTAELVECLDRLADAVEALKAPRP